MAARKRAPKGLTRGASRKLRRENIARSLKAGAAVGTQSELVSPPKKRTRPKQQRRKPTKQLERSADVFDAGMVVPGSYGTGKKRNHA